MQLFRAPLYSHQQSPSLAQGVLHPGLRVRPEDRDCYWVGPGLVRVTSNRGGLEGAQWQGGALPSKT